MGRSFRARLNELERTDKWYGVIIDAYSHDYHWLVAHHSTFVSELQRKWRWLMPYALNARRLFHFIDSNLWTGDGLPASLVLRNLLERVALINFGRRSSTDDFQKALCDLQGDDRGARVRLTECLIKRLDQDFAGAEVLFNVLSRYFSHVSYAETLSSSPATSLFFADDYYKPTGIEATYTVFFMVAFDVLDIYCQLIESTASVPERIYSMRQGTTSARDMIYVCRELFGGRVTKSRPLHVRVLLRGAAGIPGELGIDAVYRGRMDIHRFGDKPPPPLSKIKEAAVFAIGSEVDISKEVKAFFHRDLPNGEKYQLKWKEGLDYTRVLVMLVSASVLMVGRHEYFDYIAPVLNELSSAKSSNPAV